MLDSMFEREINLMKKIVLPAALLLASLSSFFSLAHAAGANDVTGFTLGAVVKNMSRVSIGADHARVDIVAEGAGAITAQGKTVHFYAMCNVVDTLAGTKQVDGAGDCELKSTGTGVGYLHFRSDADHGDRGTVALQGGTGDFADLAGSVPVDVSVNPAKVGKPVFYVENRPANATAAQ